MGTIFCRIHRVRYCLNKRLSPPGVELQDLERMHIFEKKKMRNILFLFLVTLISVHATAQSSFATAVEYNDYIVVQQDNVGTAINTLMGNLNLDSATVWAYYNLGLATTQVSRDNIKNMPDFNNTSYFKNASLELFQYYVDVFTVEFKEVVTIYFDVNVPFENKLDKMNPIFDVIAAKEMKFDENFAKAQQQFATENNFELIIPETVEEE